MILVRKAFVPQNVHTHTKVIRKAYIKKLAGVQGWQGFPDSSVDKESACNAGNPSSLPGSGRSPGEGIGYPLQYSWASLIAQLVKNLPAMWETWVRCLGWEDPLEKGKATSSSILENSLDCIVHGILQARILEWVAFPFSRGSSQPRHRTQVSHIAGGFFTS